MNREQDTIKIAICEDSQQDMKIAIERLQQALHLIGMKSGEFALYTFDNGEKLLKSNLAFDLILQDIELGNGMDGIEVGYKIKKLYPACLIIFLTHHDDLRDCGFDVGNFWYLEKTASERSFQRAISRAIAHIKDVEWLTFDIINEYDEKERKSLRTNEMIYIESQGGRTYLKTKSELLMTTYSLKKWTEVLPLDKFMRCHKSFIVNLDYAKPIIGNELVYNLVLKNGDAISVAKSYIKQLNKKLHGRIRQRGRM